MYSYIYKCIYIYIYIFTHIYTYAIYTKYIYVYSFCTINQCIPAAARDVLGKPRLC